MPVPDDRFIRGRAPGVVAAGLRVRPFDSTDADVAPGREFELELGPAGYLREGEEHFLVGSAVIGNLGIGNEREIVLEGKLKTPLNTAAGSQSILEDSAVNAAYCCRRFTVNQALERAASDSSLNAGPPRRFTSTRVLRSIATTNGTRS